MKRNLIKLILAAFFAVITSSAMAQIQGKGNSAIGPSLVFGSGDGFTNFGFSTKMYWYPLTKLRLEPSFTYFLEKKNLFMMDISANANYLIPLGSKVSFYPLAGYGTLCLITKIGNESATDFVFGPNLGGGIDIEIKENVFLNFQMKYMKAGYTERITSSVGLIAKF